MTMQLGTGRRRWTRRRARPGAVWLACALAVVLSTVCAVPSADAQARFLGREEIVLYGLGLKVEPEQQTVPKGFATIVGTYLQTPQVPGPLPPFAPDAELRATLRGPSFPNALDLVAAPNSPFNIPILTVPGTHTLENVRLVSGGEVLLYGSPQSVKIEVIEKLLVTTVTARPLTAAEIREKGIVFDKSNYQAYDFTAAFAIGDGSEINVTFPVVLPTVAGPEDARVTAASLASIDAPVLQSLSTLIPDTLKIGARIPNLTVTGFTLTLDSGAAEQEFYVPPIPGVIVIPGDIGFLNQFFSVLLMVANVAPAGSNLVVSDLTADIVLPAGLDKVAGSADDPLRMAQTATGASPPHQRVTQAGADGKLGTGDDITTLGPGETGNAEYLVEGRREGTWVVEMELTGTLNGMPVGPVPVRGRAAGVVLVRNPKFTLTFTHPDVVNAGEPYTLDVTVTNTSGAPANFVSVNLYSQNISGAALDDEPTKSVEYIAPDDSATMTFKLISQRTGIVTAATLDSAEQVEGRFALKTAVGELGVPLSPDSLVLPKEAGSLPKAVRDAALGLLGRAWAVATAPPIVFPKDLERFSKQIVLGRAVETAEAGFRILLGAPIPQAVADLWMDMLGSEYSRLGERVEDTDPPEMLSLLQADVRGFDLLRRKSVRGDAFADQAASAVLPWLGAAGAAPFHQAIAAQFTSRPGHLSILVAGDGASDVPVDAVLTDAAGRRLGGLEAGRTVKEIPYGDVLTFRNGDTVTARLLLVAVPEPGAFHVTLSRKAGAAPGALYGVSVAYPGADLRLRFASFPDLGPAEVPALQQPAGDPYLVTFSLAGAASPQAREAAGAAVTDPPPSVLGAVQMAEADVVGCSAVGLENRRVRAGRVIAVLFSEEVTPESVQDAVTDQGITAFAVEGNRVLDVALQPGNRIAYVALREPVGRFVDRTITVTGVADTRGNVLASASVPIQATVTDAGGVVSGKVLNADGTPAQFAEVRLFYEFRCDEEGTVVVGIASDFADAEGRYQFDYVSLPVAAVKMVAINTEADDLRTQRFTVSRDGQLLNLNMVFLGRGAFAGRTLAEDGVTPLANTSLRVTSLTDESQYGATSDAAGAFEIRRIPVGNILVEAVNTARPASVFLSDYIPSAGATVTRDLVLLDVSTTQITVKTGSVSGRVLRSDGTTRVPGVQVVAYYRNESQPGVRCSPPPGSLSGAVPSECAIAIATTLDDGSFVFPAISAGELRLYTFDQAALQEGGVRFLLAEDQALDVSLLLGGGLGTVHGVVLDGAGNPVPDAEVGGGLSLTTVNPADGTFTLTDVPVGRRVLVAVSASLGATGRTTIDIVREGEVVNAAIVLESMGAVAGIVRDRGGAPQPGIHVYVIQPGYDDLGREIVCVKGEATTDANGAYRVNGLVTGSYTVSAFLPDMSDGNLAQAAIRYHGQVLKTDITFRGGSGTVTGRVLRAKPAGCDEADPSCAETPLPARVAISGDRLVTAGGIIGVAFQYVQHFAIVDNNMTTGAFTFTNVWTGPFTVRAAGQFSPEPVAAEGVMPGPGETVTVDLRLQPTSVITGVVLEPDGVTPVTGRQVSLRFSSNAVVVFCSEESSTGMTSCTSIPQGIQEEYAVTDGTGRFSFPLVNPGAFTVTATDLGTGTGGHVAEVKGAVKPGETLDLHIRLLGAARATVNVYSHDGQTPIPNAAVELQQIDYPKASRSGTAVSGTITFDGLGEGQFVVKALGPGGFAGRASGTITGEGADAVVNVYLYDATGTVTGLVTRLDSEGTAVAVPNAEVILSSGGKPIAFAVTDSGGSYTVTLVPVGDFRIEVFDPVTAGRGRASGTVTGGAIPIEANVLLDALGVVRGVVVESGTLDPLKGWQVRLAQVTPSGRSLPALVTMTSVDGSYSFPGASVGTFSVRAWKSGVVGEAAVTGEVSRPGQLVEVPIVVTVVRRVTGTVAGTVFNPDGSAASNAQIDVCPASEACRPTVNSPDGRFSIGDIPLGRFTVKARAQVTGNPSAGTAGGTLLFEGDTADVQVTLVGLGAVQGRVFEIVNSVKTPAAYASVLLYGQPGSGCAGPCHQSTDADGAFSFVNVPARTFTVAASKEGQRGSVGDTLNAGETKTGLEVILAPAVSFTGRVRLANGLPAIGIVADLARGTSHLYAESDPDGVFSYDAVGSGPYVLLLQDPVGGGIARLSGTILANTPVDLGDILLDEQPPAVAATSPAAGEFGVSLTPEIRVTFTEAVSPGTVTAANVSVSGPSGPLTGLLDVVDGDTVARFRLLSGSVLDDHARYTIRVRGVEDRYGKPMAGETVVSFTTADSTPPSVIETTPVASASGVPIDSVVRVKYSEIIDPSRFAGPAITVSAPGGAVAGAVEFILGNTVVVFTPALPLARDTTYAVHVAAATDLSGQTQASGVDFTFTTTDSTPPQVTALVAANGGRVIENTVAVVTATVSAGDVAFVDFLVNGTLTSTVRTARDGSGAILPFTLAFQATPGFGAPGSLIGVAAVATDTSGNRGPASSTVVEVVADAPPAAEITAPPAGTQVAGGARVTVRVHAADDVGLAQAGYVARTTAGIIQAATSAFTGAPLDATAEFAFTVPAGLAPGAVITVEASAVDVKAQATAAAPVTLSVIDTAGPAVAITGVTSGERVRPGQRVTIVVTAEDAGLVARVGFAAIGAGVATSGDRDVSPAQASVATSFSFDVPVTADSGEQVDLSAYAIDAAGNRTEAAHKILTVADAVAPAATLRTSDGSLFIVPGSTVSIVVTGSDDMAVATLALTGSGAFTFSDSYSVTAPVSTASHTFVVSVPAGVAHGATVLATAIVTDVSGNVSTPVSLTLTAKSVVDVTLPGSVVLRAGERADLAVGLTAPAASAVVVTLQSSAPGVATVTSSVAFSAGETTKAAAVTGVAGGTAQITAYVSGVARATSTATVIGGVVRGTVGDPDPVAGAQVTIFHGGAPIAAVTDASGAFDVEGVIGTGTGGRAFTVRAAAGELLGYADALLSVRGGHASVSVMLVPLSTIAGTVYHADGATAAGEGVQVDLYEAASPSTIVSTAFTNAEGRFEFRLVAQGTYILVGSDLAGNKGRTTVSVGASGQEVTADIGFLGRGTVTGIVRDGAGAAVAYAQVELHSSSIFGTVTRTATAGAEGTFAFSGVFIGGFSVTAYDTVTGKGGSASGQVTTNGQTVGVTVTLASYGNVEGTVYRSGGTTTVSGASVAVDCGGVHRSTVTDTSGRYAFALLPFAPFTIRVTDPGTRALGAASGSGFPHSGATVTADVVLRPQGALLVTVTDHLGTPLNGAAVTASVTASVGGVTLTDTLSAVTARLNDTDGLALLSPLMAGPFTVHASSGGLVGDGAGTIAEGGQAAITLQLQAPPPMGTISGVVYEPDGQTPAAGWVRVQGAGRAFTATLAGGAFSVPNLLLGSYRIDAYDTANRLRAFDGSPTLTADGQVVTRALVFVGLGRVLGMVTNPFSGDASNLTVQVRSYNASFGGVWTTRTGAAGEYAIAGVPVGPLTVIAWSADGLLRAEASRELAQPNQDLTVDLVLQNNTFTKTQWLYDVNDTVFGLEPKGDRFTGGVKSLFANGGAVLTVTRDGSSVTFSGQSFGTLEDGGRETVSRQNGIHGLNVVRKFYVPAEGHFVRVLESFANPTAADITIDVTAWTKMTPSINSGLALTPRMTSSGNSAIELGAGGVRDHWAVFDDSRADVDAYYATGYAAPVAFVWDEEGAAVQASAATVTDLGNETTVFGCAWAGVTVPAGGTVTIMHFVSQQVNLPASIQSAQRIVQLPPEALAGLDADELAAIVNFAVPQDGVSSVAPLPAVTGIIDGHVFEGDGVTPVPGASVYFRSLHPLYGRVWSATADAGGSYRFTGGPRRPVPLAGTELRAKYPHTAELYTEFALGALSDAAPALTEDLAFAGTGIVGGFVRRHTGAVVTSGTVVVSRGSTVFASQAIAANGSYAFGGLPASETAYSLAAVLPGHPQGTGLKSLPAAAMVTAGHSTLVDIPIEPTGRLEGVVVDEAGQPVPNRMVDWYRLAPGGGYEFQRITYTDTAGRFASDDMPVGSYTARTYTPGSGFTITAGFTVTQDATTQVTLSYHLPGTFTATVLRSTGAPAPGVEVSLSGGSFYVPPVTTDALGRAVFTGLPVGQWFFVDARTATDTIEAHAKYTLQESAGGFGALTLTLPPFGTIQGTVTLPNGAPLQGPNYGQVELPSFGRTLRVQTTYSFEAVPINQPIVLRAYRYGERGNYLDTTVTLAADGEVRTVNTHVPAVATVRVRVTQAGSPVAGAQVHLADRTHYLFCDPVHPGNGVTDADGVLSFTGVIEGPVEVRAYPASPPLPSNFNVCYGYASPSVTLERAFATVTAADDGGVVDMPIAAGTYTVTVSGIVTLADGVTPVPKQNIDILRAADFKPAAASGSSLTTDASGQFAMTPSATVTAAGVLVRTVSPGGTGYVDTIVPVSADGPVYVKAVMPALTATVSGQALTSDGVTPVAQAFRVSMYAAGGQGLGTVSSSGDGQFAFATRALPTDGVRLVLRMDGLQPIEQYSGAITQNGQAVTVNFTLPPTITARITGSVVSIADHQTPIKGAFVELLVRDSAERLGDTQADADGRYSISAVLPADGLFTLVVRARYDSPNYVALEGSATSQNQTVSMPAAELPGAILKGVVRFHDGQPVPSPGIVGRDEYGREQYAWATGPDGSYLCFGWPAGAYTVTAQDTDSGLLVSGEAIIPSDSSLVTLDLTMPPSGTVSVTVLDQSGAQVADATVALVSDALWFERLAGPSEHLKPTPEGKYVFTHVPTGGLYVQAARSATYASTEGVLAAADETVNLTVSFQYLGSVQGEVLDNPEPTKAVGVRLTALRSGGPLGRYVKEFSLPAGTTQYTVMFVPPGPVRVEAAPGLYGQGVPAGQADGVLAPGTPGVLTLDLPIGNASTFGRQLTIPLAGGAFTYRVTAGGLVSASLSDGSLPNTLYYAGELGIGVNRDGMSYVPAARAELEGRQLVIGPETFGRLRPFQLTRKVYVPADGRFARWLDVVTSPSDSPHTIRLTLTSPINGSSLSELVEPSDMLPGYALFSGYGNIGSSAYVFASAQPPVAPVDAMYDSSPRDYPVIRAYWDVEVPAHGSIALLHFAIAAMPADADAARTLAFDLAALADPAAIEGLTEDELALIVNMRVPPPGPIAAAWPAGAQPIRARSLAGVWEGHAWLAQPAEEPATMEAGK
ncbi:MAG TPA: Ig-like domain-containing protein [Vicinamibacterales bacterium]|nr:Ig-like domain-containing protein [Vicinamibacterales bacterium]